MAISCFFFQAEDGIRDLVRSRGLGDVYKRRQYEPITTAPHTVTFTGTGEVDSLNHVGYEHVPGIYDLVTEMAGMVVRPRLHSRAWVSVQNAGTETAAPPGQVPFDENPQ